MKEAADAANLERAGDIIMLKKLTAAVIAAATAIIPFSANSRNVSTFTNVYAEETSTNTPLPDWIPDSFDSAVRFRNTYGATHIDNGLICIVLLNEYCIPANNVLRYDTVTTKNAMDTVSRKVYSSDMTKTKLEVIVYKPLVQGDIEVDIVDIMIQAPSLDLGYHHASGYYTFTVDNNFNITETDIYSWLPDSKSEYNEYVKMKGEVSVKDNYVVFCTMAVDQFGDKWEPASTNKYENIKDLLSSDCTMQLPELYDDGSVDKIYVYQAVKDGYEKISWTRTSNMRPNQSEPTTYTLTADCAVIDDAQTVMLSGDMRVTLVDYDTGELLTLPEDAIPRIWTDVRQSTPDGEIVCNMQPPGLINNPGFIRLGDLFDGYNFSFGLVGDNLPIGYSLPDTEDRSAGYYNGTIVPEDYMTVKKYDNNTADVVFRLKKVSKRVLPEEKSAELTDLKKGETKITVYDKDTGELLPSELVKHHNVGFGTDIRFRSNMSPNGWMYTGPIYAVESNPQVYQTDLANLYRSADYFEFLCDDQPEVTLYDNGSMDLVIRTKINISGNINGDNKFNIADIVALQRWLLNAQDIELSNWAEADFDLDSKLTIFDLVLMRKALLSCLSQPVEISVKEEAGGVTGAIYLYKVYSTDNTYWFSYQNQTTNPYAEPFTCELTESEYREIMSQDYDSMIQNMNGLADSATDACAYTLELGYPGSSKKKAVSTNMPDVLIKLKTLKEDKFNFVEPNNISSYGLPFTVLEDGLRLYAGPDESYAPLAILYKGEQLHELGYNNNNDTWLFTSCGGNYGWIKTVQDDNRTPTIRYEVYADKPVIYLYPEQETDVHVELDLTEAELSTTYPKYNNGWDVIASPDGSLLNKADGTHHKYLFWDAANSRTRYDLSKGFCVAGKDAESFLKEKLTYMGLNEEEMNEFIVYWLPRMEHNKYNLIAFQGDAYTNSARLNITPTPDSLLRIFMTYIPLEEAVDLEPQQLVTYERKGFTVVEWGGSEIES